MGSFFDFVSALCVFDWMHLFCFRFSLSIFFHHYPFSLFMVVRWVPELRRRFSNFARTFLRQRACAQSVSASMRMGGIAGAPCPVHTCHLVRCTLSVAASQGQGWHFDRCTLVTLRWVAVFVVGCSVPISVTRVSLELLSELFEFLSFMVCLWKAKHFEHTCIDLI